MDYMEKRINIQGLSIHNIDYMLVLSFIKKYLNSADKKTICFISAHCVNVARKDSEYKSIVNNFDLILPDGIGMAFAGMMNKTPIKENLNGTDLIPRLFNDLKQLKVFLLGGKPGVVEKVKVNLENKFPSINIVGYMHGYFSDEKEICNEMSKCNPDIILVAMGVPLQEKLIQKNKDKINTKLFIGVGGLFDFIAGINKRAPKCMRKLGLEWIYRIYQEPKRMWKRYIIGGPVFFYHAFKEMIYIKNKKLNSE
jgi:N-acetylglucosaminyldiphosphoundecaprenol N-acetyl-beta-D-mannosaminyltransferase